MEWKVYVLCLCAFIATITATKVKLSNVWKPDLGWEVTCSWTLYSNDSLQSVRLYNNDQQFLIYRPEAVGEKLTQIFRRPEDMIRVDCAESTDRGVTGTCILTTELYQPQKYNYRFGCEVSGERPTFRMEKADIFIDPFVPPTAAVIEVGSENTETQRVMLNCTASGLPAPNLAWTIGEQKVPHDFTGSVWNATSKLWQVWSLLSYTPSSEHAAVCTPEISRGSQLVKGDKAEYNSASNVKDVRSIMLTVLTSLFILR